MSEVIEKARKRLAQLEAEMAELRTFLDVYGRLAGGTEGERPDLFTGISRPVANPPQRDTAGPKQIVEAAKALMLEKERPLTRTELVRLLTLRGIRIPGTDKSKNVGPIIWRSHEVDNIEGKGYWPKDAEPWKGYHPNDELSVRPIPPHLKGTK